MKRASPQHEEQLSAFREWLTIHRLLTDATLATTVSNVRRVLREAVETNPGDFTPEDLARYFDTVSTRTVATIRSSWAAWFEFCLETNLPCAALQEAVPLQGHWEGYKKAIPLLLASGLSAEQVSHLTWDVLDADTPLWQNLAEREPRLREGTLVALHGPPTGKGPFKVRMVCYIPAEAVFALAPYHNHGLPRAGGPVVPASPGSSKPLSARTIRRIAAMGAP